MDYINVGKHPLSCLIPAENSLSKSTKSVEYIMPSRDKGVKYSDKDNGLLKESYDGTF